MPVDYCKMSAKKEKIGLSSSVIIYFQSGVFFQFGKNLMVCHVNHQMALHALDLSNLQKLHYSLLCLKCVGITYKKMSATEVFGESCHTLVFLRYYVTGM